MRRKRSIFDKALLWKLGIVVTIATFCVLYGSNNGVKVEEQSSSVLNIKAVEKNQESETIIESTKSTNAEQDFLVIAKKTGTDKVDGHKYLPSCLKNPNSCLRKGCERKECGVWGHYYDTFYNRWLGKFSTQDAEPFQFLEIGYYNGKGFDAYTNYLPRGEMHSMEISCLPEGPRSEGLWPKEWGNFAIKNKKYESLRKARRLHCGDASNYDFLHKIWTTEMKRKDAPPLKIVVDDGSHVATQMAASLFFWIPRIEPGGIFVMEDIQPIEEPNPFRTHILPQLMKDIHWCGDPKLKDTRCFPDLQPFIFSIHCEMHICAFLRNDKPTIEPDKATSTTPPGAFSNAQKCLFGPH